MSQAHLSAILAFTLWGLFPLYWKFFSEAPAWDLFGHRLIWSTLTLAIILLYKNQFGAIKKIWHIKKTRNLLILSALLISSNWLLYIYAISIGKVLEASMGYFLNPLFNILMGWLLLNEKLRSTQWPSIFLAGFGIILIAIQGNFSSFPWIALTLSITFALYGLIRKVTHVGSIEGLAFETSIIIFPVIFSWFFMPTTPLSILSILPGWKLFILSLSGIVTCLPLILFAYSAKRLPLRTLGFIQYLSPSFKFICGLFVLGESLSRPHLQAFYFIWLALIWYTMESFYFKRKSKL